MLVLESNMLDSELPPALEAHEPPEARGLARDQVRLLVSHLEDDRIEHKRFTDLPSVLRPGDVVVANDSGTLAAALTVSRSDGSGLNLHVSTRLPAGLWVVEPRRIQAHQGETFGLPDGSGLRLLAPYTGSSRLWIAQFDPDVDVAELLNCFGRAITYPYVRGQWPIEMYQTVYAAAAGSAEMPSAGRAFSPNVLEQLAHHGIEFVTLTLHTGVASLEGHERPYAEEYTVPERTASVVRAAKADGRRVIAVGTTVVRALESAADAGEGDVIATRAWTELVITPERGVRVVDGLLTGFHEPKASHLAMLEAIAGRCHLERAYRAALDGGYLWHEFGDLHLIV
jgi:S-adenosylmethionine:tRNA ribosyltransferase-isomerase